MDAPLDIPKVLALFDVDCFFCQVESKRDSSLHGKPFVVHQHEDIISISYEALGVKKHEKPADVRRRCPAVVLVSVPKGVGSKVSYQSYQQASERVKALIADRTNGSPIERASIDEYYVDLTSHVAKTTRREEADSEDPFPPSLIPTSDVHIEGGASVAFLSPVESRMMAASVLVREIRHAILAKEGFTVSAGIAHTKMLAKFASAMHKPNKQTVVLFSAAPKILSEYPIRRVPGLSRVLRADVDEAHLRSGLGTLLGRSRTELCAQFGEAGNLLYDAARGVETSPVTPSGPPKSLSSSMSLTPVSTFPAVTRVLGFAAKDLGTRLETDAQKFHRHPQNIIFRYRYLDAKEVGFTISARLLPVPSSSVQFTEALVTASFDIFKKNTTRSAWQLRWFSFTASRFTSPTAHNLEKFFQVPALVTAATASTLPAAAEPHLSARLVPIEIDSSEEKGEQERGQKRARD